MLIAHTRSDRWRFARRRRLLLAVGMLTAAGCTSSSNPTSPSVPFTQTDVIVGSGATAVAGQRLTVNYTGWLYDAARTEQKGSQFDTSIGRGPFAFTLGAGTVIRGWDQGVVGMRVGGRRRLVIPPELGYGSSGSGAVPGNAVLVFDIDLLSAQ